MDNIMQFIGKISEEGLKVNILLDEFLSYVFIWIMPHLRTDSFTRLYYD